MRVRLEDCFVRIVRTSHDPATSSAASQPMTEADVLELARQLPGAEERVRPNGQRILVIELEPAPEHEPMIPGDVEWALPEEHQ